MKYLLSKDELMKFNELYDVEDFLKSKTPVEEIAGGRCYIYEFSYCDGKEVFIEETNLAELLKEKQCKNIKIYIEVIK